MHNEPADDSVSTSRSTLSLMATLKNLRQQVLRDEQKYSRQFERVHPQFLASAKNLIHYLSLRQNDLSDIQQQLALLGLSSLGRSEAHVLETLNAVIARLEEHLQIDAESVTSEQACLQANNLLRQNAQRLLGPAPADRDTRIMVTLPSEAAQEVEIAAQLLSVGMNCVRINCAHDSQEDWALMIDNLRLAQQICTVDNLNGQSVACKIAMDLGGPKIRTGDIAAGPAVLKISPLRDKFGGVIRAAKVWISASHACDRDPNNSSKLPDNHLVVSENWIKSIQLIAAESDAHRYGEIRMTDARGATRKLTVTAISADGVWVESYKTVYLANGTLLRYRQYLVGQCAEEISQIRPLEQAITLRKNDYIELLPAGQTGAPAEFVGGRCVQAAKISCSLPGVLNCVRVGEPIFFDDGKIAGIFEEVTPECARVRITQAGIHGSKLRADKGINLPETRLALSALTPKDIRDLEFAAREADIINLSFVNSPSDIEELLAHLELFASARADKPAIVLKIETRLAVENLPHLLLSAMAYPKVGVMIARGDLAVECGFNRLAELQEDILCLCEAAHLPVIWATQVLENLAKKGLASRAEISDAAMGHRAECIMLNKGPHIQDAVATLANILARMQRHQNKRMPVMSQLNIAQHFNNALQAEPIA